MSSSSSNSWLNPDFEASGAWLGLQLYDSPQQAHGCLEVFQVEWGQWGQASGDNLQQAHELVNLAVYHCLEPLGWHEF